MVLAFTMPTSFAQEPGALLPEPDLVIDLGQLGHEAARLSRRDVLVDTAKILRHGALPGLTGETPFLRLAPGTFLVGHVSPASDPAILEST